MSKTAVPDEVRRFILTSIPSVPYLEALLLLRADETQHWDAISVARRLYIGENQAQDLLNALRQSGVAGTGDGSRFAYAPATEELRQRLDTLATTYAQNLVGVTDLIHSRIDKRAQQFADAFRFRKDAS